MRVYLIALFLVLSIAAHAQEQPTLIWQEDFELAAQQYTSSTVFFDGRNDYWGRTNNSQIHTGGGDYHGYSGDFFWAAEDTDDNGGNGAKEQSILFDAVVTEGYEHMVFTGSFAAGDTDTYDDTDYIRVLYSLDGGDFIEGLCFSAATGDSTHNKALATCADNHLLTTEFQAFSFALPPANSVQIQILVSMDADGEEIAFDNLMLRDVSDTALLPVATATPSPTLVPESTQTATLIITEIMINPASPEDDWEWVEIYNAGEETIDLTGFVLDDNNSRAHTSRNIYAGSIDPQQTAILFNADDISRDEFHAAWGADINLIAVSNWNALSLNNGGDKISLWSSYHNYYRDETAHSLALATVDYNDSAFPNASGASIYLRDITQDYTNGTNWDISAAFTSQVTASNSGADIGSPGQLP